MNDVNNEMATVSATERISFEDRDFLNRHSTAEFNPDADKEFKADFKQRLAESQIEINTLSGEQ